MIISLRSMSYQELKNNLSRNDTIVINGCNACVRACGISGTQKIDKLAQMLTNDGYNVVGTDLISISCTVNLVKGHRADPVIGPKYAAASVIIPLICEDGYEVIERVFPDKKIIKIAKTIGVGYLPPNGAPVLSNPFQSTGLEEKTEGYSLEEVADKMNLYPSFFNDDVEPVEQEHVALTVDGKRITAPKGSTLLKACIENGIDIPHLCAHDDLTNYGACRLCLVKVKGMREWAASCCLEVQDGMEVTTQDAELELSRRTILELTMASGNHNCLTCQKGVPNAFGSCEFQKLVRDYNITETPYTKKEKLYNIDASSPVIEYDESKCILCGRCVRACGELAGIHNLGFINRGAETKVAVGLNTSFANSACASCMACADVCPTGAITRRVNVYTGDEWVMDRVFMSV